MLVRVVTDVPAVAAELDDPWDAETLPPLVPPHPVTLQLNMIINMSESSSFI
jgi:hypothetical protein